MNRIGSFNLENAWLDGENSEHFAVAAAICHGLEPIVKRLRKEKKFKAALVRLDVQHKLLGIDVKFEFGELDAAERYLANWTFIDKVKAQILFEMDKFSYEVPAEEDIDERRVYDTIYFTIPIGDY